MKLFRRLKLYRCQNGKCPYCRRKMDPRPSQGRGDNGFTVEHVVAAARAQLERRGVGSHAS